MRSLFDLKKILSVILEKYNVFSKELQNVSERVFCKRKIIIISEKGISSIPASSRSQGLAVLFVLLVLLWVSYSTGKYVTYENVISEKDREIWSTNITNEGLQYQMADLHNNLSDLNKYFENLRQLGKIARSPVEKSGDSKPSEVSSNNVDIHTSSNISDFNVQDVLSNIRNKVISRINSLEEIIKMTGISVDKVASNNEPLKDALLKATHLHDKGKRKSSNQGGPYEPVDDSVDLFNRSKFESEINYLMQLEKSVNALPLAKPLKEYYISSRFGRRMDPVHNRRAMHAGIDLVGPYKSKVYSTGSGVIDYAGRSGAYGRLVRVNHGSGIMTWYGHLNRVLVKKGDIVKTGQLIGLQGNTGRSTGTHLHYEVRLNRRPIDPYNFLKAGKYVF